MVNIYYEEDRKTGKEMWTFDSENWSLTIDSDGNTSGSLGNFTNAGWFWDFHENGHFLLFLDRMAKWGMLGELVSEMEDEVPIEVFRKAVRKSIENDGIFHMAYSVAGDNVAFYFGEGHRQTEEENLAYMMEKTIEGLENDPCVIEKYGHKFVDWLREHYDDVWIYSDAEDEEERICREVESLIEPLVRKYLLNARTWEDVRQYEEIRDKEMNTNEGGLFWDVLEIWEEYTMEKFIEALERWTENYEDELRSFGIKTRKNGEIWALPLDSIDDMRWRLCEN